MDERTPEELEQLRLQAEQEAKEAKEAENDHKK